MMVTPEHWILRIQHLNDMSVSEQERGLEKLLNQAQCANIQWRLLFKNLGKQKIKLNRFYRFIAFDQLDYKDVKRLVTYFPEVGDMYLKHRHVLKKLKAEDWYQWVSRYPALLWQIPTEQLTYRLIVSGLKNEPKVINLFKYVRLSHEEQVGLCLGYPEACEYLSESIFTDKSLEDACHSLAVFNALPDHLMNPAIEAAGIDSINREFRAWQLASNLPLSFEMHGNMAQFRPDIFEAIDNMLRREFLDVQQFAQLINSGLPWLHNSHRVFNESANLQLFNQMAKRYADYGVTRSVMRLSQGMKTWLRNLRYDTMLQSMEMGDDSFLKTVLKYPSIISNVDVGHKLHGLVQYLAGKCEGSLNKDLPEIKMTVNEVINQIKKKLIDCGHCQQMEIDVITQMQDLRNVNELEGNNLKNELSL